VEVNVQDWIELNATLNDIECRMAVAGPDQLMFERDVVIKKLLVFYHLFNARSDRIDEILSEEPEYATFLKYIEEAENKNAVGQEDSHDGHSAGSTESVEVLPWYGAQSPIARWGSEGKG
jgi:hypothetical protein